MATSDVLIVGAGPTGLVLALWLTRLGVPVRIVDKAPEPGRTSRALGVQARTLELYRELDLSEDVVHAGFPARALNLWVRGERRARLELGEIGAGKTPYPFALVYPQDAHERLLSERLAKLGVQVERPTELVGLEQGDERVRARLQHADGAIETCDALFVAGCDGARSFVRESLAIGFPGGTYSHLFYVADVEASGLAANGEAHFGLEDDSHFLACLALAPGHVRLIGTVREDSLAPGKELGWQDVSKRVIERMRLDVARVNWFSTYRVHHRVASTFRAQRVFLLGDAAHIHSPVGGQGMNTGIGDAVNLAWKLAAVLHRQSASAVLDSYESERIPFARRLVKTTDRVFELLSADSPIATALRVRVLPVVLARMFRSERVRGLLFDTVSELQIAYRHSWLSEGHAGSVHGGDRLPWVPGEGTDNFAPLKSLAWQLHVYGTAPGSLSDTCSRRNLSFHAFPWSSRAAEAGLQRDAAYLVRPDGYVGLAEPAASSTVGLTKYLEERQIRL